MNRQQKTQIIKDLDKKIVFLVGPRQVGKTWLAKTIGREFSKTVYLNYDSLEDQVIIKKEQWLENTELLILDELHKMKGWKNYLKGIFDTKPESLKILVTGSARLDIFRQAGDSLAGRFFVHHLLPLSLKEIKYEQEQPDLNRLLQRGGFPEPFLATDDTEADRWRSQYIDSLIRTDVLDFEKINDYKAIKMVFELLRRKVASPISYASIAEDVGVSSVTVKKYINILESLFIVFKVTPFSKKIARSILKEPKIYFYDNGLVVGDEGVRFENLVANSLLKSISGRNDSLGLNEQLHYLRTKNGHEVDFAISANNNLVEIQEVKLSKGDLSKNLSYFSTKYSVKAKQVVKELKREKHLGDIDIVKAQNYLEELFI
ncbi:MAG: ATP-binding protein [Patescibacteria group bacterium]|nr:ATP-binding protein [Patescibacteria group bacterium]